MTNKTITQLDAAQSLNGNMYIATEVNDNTCKVSLAQIKSYCLPTGTINITENGTHNVADYGTASVLVEPTIESLSIVPSTLNQGITAPSGTDGYSPIFVAAVTSSIDANIVEENIKSGVSILGVTGSLVESNNTTASVTPTTSAQTITPTSPYNGFDEINVSAVTASIDNNIVASNIKKDVEILGVTGSYEGSGGGDVITAINNTGSAVLEGDKVWINESNGSYSIEKLKEVKNFNVNGNPTINGSTGAISDFSSSNYLTLNDGFFPENNSWEYVVHFKTGNNISADQSGVFIGDSLFIGDGGNVRYLASFLQSTPSSWDIANGFLIMPISVTTEYWIKLEFTGTAYNYYSSPDGGESWSLVKSINSTSKIYGYTTPTIGTSGAHTLQFLGEIYIKDCYIKVNNELWWQPYLQTITADMQTGIAAENIAAGGTGLVNVGAVIEPTGSTTIMQNGTYDVADYAEAIVNVPVPVVDKYKVGDRVNDDSDNPVGTVSSIFFGENNKHYAVVCLDAEHRLWGGQYSASNTQIDNIPLYSNYNMYSNTDSATKNTTAILGQLSSTGCSHCRSKSFTIGGVTYYGQLPNLNELLQICILKDVINANDPTVSSYSSQKIPTSTTDFASGSTCIWSSTQQQWNGAWGLVSNGTYSSGSLSRTTAGFIIPVLEIPLEE